MKPANLLMVVASLAFPLASFATEPSLLGEIEGNTQSEEIALDPTLEKMLRELEPALARPSRPIRKLVIETKARINAGSEMVTLYDCHYEYADYGVVFRTCEKRWSKSNELTAGEVTFMGLTPPLVSASGLKGKYVIVAGPWIWRLPFKVQSKSKLVRWDADLSSIARPMPNTAWKDSYTVIRETATTGTATSRNQFSLTATRQCTVGSTRAASSVAPSLVGEAVQIECSSSGDAQSSNLWLFLVDSGLHFQLRANSSAVEMTSRILEAEYY